MAANSDTELILDAKATLGEGPAWDSKNQRLIWVDILKKELHIYHGKDHSLELAGYPGCVAPCQDGRLIAALHYGFWLLDLTRSVLTEIAVPQGEPTTNRFNDGKCDPAGRFLAGTMDIGERQANGALYSLDPSGELTQLLSGLRISNGLAWSPDYRTFYFIDTPTREVKAFDYDLDTGTLSKQRVAFVIPSDLGFPDGMTSDMEGNLWIAMWGGAQVTRWDPTQGRLLAQYKIPAFNVTSCVFGGRDMNELYVTSARKGMDEAGLRSYPLSGGLFRIQTSTTGMATFEFGLE